MTEQAANLALSNAALDSAHYARVNNEAAAERAKRELLNRLIGKLDLAELLPLED